MAQLKKKQSSIDSYESLIVCYLSLGAVGSYGVCVCVWGGGGGGGGGLYIYMLNLKSHVTFCHQICAWREHGWSGFVIIPAEVTS